VFLRSLQTLAHEIYGQSFLQELFIKKYIKIFFKSFIFSINIGCVCFLLAFTFAVEQTQQDVW
jgi:ABC-type spermidine/putrescine transport system permease subunit I